MPHSDPPPPKTPEGSRPREERAFDYIREKTNQLLTVMGTSPLRPEELDNDTLLDVDPIGIVGNSFAQVLAHLHETNHRLAAARDEIQAIFDSAGAGIMVLDRNKRIVSYNRKQEESFGLQKDREAVGSDCCLKMCRREPSAERCSFEQVMRTGKAVHLTDWSCGGRDYEVLGTPIRNAAGEITLVVLVYADVTERKRIEEELRQAKEILERQNEELVKLDRLKDNLIRDVSHELKTPVAKHFMQIELLRDLFESSRVTADERQAFESMQESIRRQQGVITNILDLAKLESGGRVYQKAPFSLDRLVGNLVAEYRHDLKRYRMECLVNVPPLTMIGDEEMTWHILSNLLTNAMKFRRRDAGAKVSIWSEEQADRVIIRVSDNGVGLSPEDLEHVFTRFYQASPSIEGSGLGMSICRRTAQDLGGSISITSEGRGKGATVTVILPKE